MERITLSVDALQKKLAQMEKDNIRFAELNFVPAQTDENHLFPAFLHFDGITANGHCEDYESIDEFCLDCEDSHKSA